MVYQQLKTWQDGQNKLKLKALSQIDWETCLFFTEDMVPDGRWGTNIAGNSYLAGYDDSFYYINTDGSVYCRAAPPDSSTPHKTGSSLYVSPVNSRHYTPSRQERDQDRGKYFIGFDWKTDERKYYWDDGADFVVRTLKKNLDFSPQLERQSVRTYANKDGVERVITVDEDCNYLGENKIIMEELKDLPDEDPGLMLADDMLHLPPVRNEEPVLNKGDLKAENIVKMEEDRLQEIDAPLFSQTEENKREEHGESLPDDDPSNVDDLRRIDDPFIVLAPEIVVSKSDSQPRSSRRAHQTLESFFPSRVTKKKNVSRK